MRVPVLLSLLILVFSLRGQGDREFEVSVSSANVSISGKTNLNRFVCGLTLDDVADTLLIDAIYAGDTLTFSGLFLKFPIDAFECEIKLMNGDFRAFLKSHIYPELLMSIEQMVVNKHQSLMEKVSVQSQVNINLCGKNKRYIIEQAYVMELPGQRTKLVCTEVVRFTDFEMIPPSKFFGTVQVEDELVISLDIVLSIKQA